VTYDPEAVEAVRNWIDATLTLLEKPGGTGLVIAVAERLKADGKGES
jgi:hypothetical protein